jgi:hypothetical protein
VDALTLVAVTLTGTAVGYFLRPLGELTAEVLRDRRKSSARRTTFQIDNLIDLTTALETWRTTPYSVEAATQKERVRALAFRVRDDALRGKLEALLALDSNDPSWITTHDDVMRRLGEVLRAF